MSIKDRIAALKAKESTPVKPASSDAPATPASAEGASRRPSVADRIANMKAQSAAASPAPKSPAVGKWSAPTTPAAVPAPAAGTGQNETDLPISPPPGSSEAPETAVEPPSTPSAPAVDGATASTPEATEPKKSSIADRIASLKQGGSPPPMRMASKSMIQKGSAPLFPDPSAASPAADNAPGAAGAAGTGSEGVSEEPKRRSSIADRIAALKAAPVAAAPPAAEDSTGTGAGTGAPIAKRRLSTDRVAFANSIPLMMPGAPRPMMMFPKVVDEEHAKESAKEETNAGEFAHVSPSSLCCWCLCVCGDGPVCLRALVLCVIA